LRLDFENSSSSKEIDFVGEVHEVSPIPGSCAKNEGGEIKEEAVPVPNKFKWI
jgi:hypothetical protein